MGITTIEGEPDRGCPQGGDFPHLHGAVMVNDLLQDLQKRCFHIYG